MEGPADSCPRKIPLVGLEISHWRRCPNVLARARVGCVGRACFTLLFELDGHSSCSTDS